MTARPTITRKNIKHLYLRIDQKGQLVVSAPMQMPMSTILEIIKQKATWIQNKQQRQHRLQTLNRKNHYDFMLLGKRYPINRRISKKNTLYLDDFSCHILLKEEDKKHQQAVENKLIKQYYKQQLLPIIHQWVNYYQPIIGVQVNEVRTKDMKTRWGSCNISAKRLWFSLALAKFSEKHIVYVVVHEMVHLQERYHNKRFYQLIEKAMPDWEMYHKQLKKPFTAADN